MLAHPLHINRLEYLVGVEERLDRIDTDRHIMASSATAAYEPHHLDQILSLLHDQRQCLTLRTIMLELTVTRCVARSLMNEVVRQCCGGNNGIDGENDDDEMVDVKRRNKYHVVRMRVSMDENNCRRVELVADSDGDGKVKGEGGIGGGGSSIFSISLAMPEDAVDNDDDNDDGVDDDEEDVDENGNPIHGKKDNHTPASLKNNHHPVLLEQLVAAGGKAAERHTGKAAAEVAHRVQDRDHVAHRVAAAGVATQSESAVQRRRAADVEQVVAGQRFQFHGKGAGRRLRKPRGSGLGR